MNGSGPIRRRYFLLLAPLLCASVALPAARSDAAEAPKMSAAEVAEGLNTIQVIAGDVVSSAANKAKAEMIAEGIEPIWAKIEDTIKANDRTSYDTMEKGIHGLEEAAKAGDTAKAGGSGGVIASAVKFYVAKYPGDAKAAAAPAPAERKAAAAPAESKASTPPRAADAAPAAAPAAAEAGDATLARTGDGAAALTALAGAAFGLGGLAIAAGARRRRLSPIA